MSGKIIFGFIIFFFGLGLLLDRVGVINFSVFTRSWWPLVLIIMGFGNIFSQTKSKLGGIILLILGFSFLLVTTSTIDRNILSFIWPIILIIIGLWLMLPFNKKSFKEHINSDNQIQINNIFSYQMLKLDSKELIGGQITAVFSGFEIDLTNCEMVENGATIELNSVFSGLEILVPKNWNVKVVTQSIFGAVENNLVNANNVDSIEENSQVLTIKGVAIFSGVEIKAK